MFNIEYSLKLGDESYNSKYSTTGKNSNLFIIRAPNDKGKTTTLKIIAHAFGVLEQEDDSISEEIRREIATLNDKDTKLSYNISITSLDKSLKIDITYDGKEKRYNINNKTVGKTELVDKIQVLFDIPEPLQKKVEGAINSVETVLKGYRDSATRYKGRLIDLNEQVLRFEDRENKKASVTSTIKQLEENLKNLYEHEKNYKNVEAGVRRKFVIYRYGKLTDEFSLKEEDLKQVNRKIKESTSQEGARRNTGKKLEEAGGNAKILIVDSKESFLSSELIEDQQKYEKILKRTSLLSYSEKVNNKLIAELSEYFEEISKKASELAQFNTFKVSDNDKQELELISKLLEILKKFSGINPEIPGLGKRMSDLIVPLSQRENELKRILRKSLIPDEIISKCASIKDALNKVSLEAGKYLDETESKDFVETDADPKILRRRKIELEDYLDKITKELDTLYEELKSVPEKERRLPIDPKIEEEYEKAKRDTAETTDEIKKVSENLDNQKNLLLEKYTSLTSPNTKMTSQEIKSLITKTENLESKLIDYLDALKRIDIKNMKMKDDNTKNKEVDMQNDSYLLSKIGEYLADVVQIIYHNHQSYNLRGIDFENRQYIIKNGNPIKFAYLGTGHTNLNSLLAKIKQPSGGRKKIILIDEIGNMDKENQLVLTTELANEIREGRAILSLLTEPSNDENDISFEPVEVEAKQSGE